VIKATIELLGEYPATEITFRMVAERAGVSRPTVYKFFDDVPSLVAKCTVDFLEKSLEDAEDGLSMLDFEGDIDYLTELMRRFVKLIYDKHVFCEHAVFSPASPQIVREAIPLIDERMSTRLVSKRLSSSGDIGKDYRNALSAGVVWLLIVWLRSDFKGPNTPDNFADRLGQTLYQFSNVSE
jgi:AcrR family transcriptional regulator